MAITLINIPSNPEGPQMLRGNPIRDPGGNFLLERDGGTLTHHLTTPADGAINTDINGGAIAGTPVVGPWRACTAGLPVIAVVSASQVGVLTVEDSSNGSTVSSSRIVGPLTADLQGATGPYPYLGGMGPVPCGSVPVGCRFTTNLTYYRVTFTPLKTSQKVQVFTQQRAS